MTAPTNLGRLREFVIAFGALLDKTGEESRILEEGGHLLAKLVRHDDWLPGAWAEPDAEHYRQYLLHCDSTEQFSVVSFVWGPGQSTPVHDHGTWGLVGMLRGSETSEPWSRRPDGTMCPSGPGHRLTPGDVEKISVAAGDVHRVANALTNAASISIHVYGANIGQVKRSVYTLDGTARPFVSGYSNSTTPNFWGKT
ncbi:MAG: cysteine dioxygenase [Novosphingobium sp.]|nr:cysteine dioxygenase [Novosphingobium sp.]